MRIVFLPDWYTRTVPAIVAGMALGVSAACGTAQDDPADAPRVEAESPAPAAGTGEVDAERAPSGAAQDYLRFAGVIDGDPPPAMNVGHDYTAEGLRRLAAALESLDGGNARTDLRSAAASIRARADDIQQDATASTHARAVREAFVTAAETLGAVGGDADARRLADRARAVSPDVPLLQQGEHVRAFFQESAEVIRRISAA